MVTLVAVLYFLVGAFAGAMILQLQGGLRLVDCNQDAAMVLYLLAWPCVLCYFSGRQIVHDWTLPTKATN
jgi:hypothetical protein